MTDAEIIKALETCIGPEVVKLYICNIESEISIITVAEITDLIKRQQAEIERLSDRNHKCIYLSDEETTEYCVDAICPKFKTPEQIKAEAVKEFAEKLKEKLWSPTETWLTDDIVTEKQIDEVLEEMVGANNDR